MWTVAFRPMHGSPKASAEKAHDFAEDESKGSAKKITWRRRSKFGFSTAPPGRFLQKVEEGGISLRWKAISTSDPAASKAISSRSIICPACVPTRGCTFG